MPNTKKACKTTTLPQILPKSKITCQCLALGNRARAHRTISLYLRKLSVIVGNCWGYKRLAEHFTWTFFTVILIYCWRVWILSRQITRHLTEYCVSRRMYCMLKIVKVIVLLFSECQNITQVDDFSQVFKFQLVVCIWPDNIFLLYIDSKQHRHPKPGNSEEHILLADRGGGSL